MCLCVCAMYTCHDDVCVLCTRVIMRRCKSDSYKSHLAPYATNFQKKTDVHTNPELMALKGATQSLASPPSSARANNNRRAANNFVPGEKPREILSRSTHKIMSLYEIN